MRYSSLAHPHDVQFIQNHELANSHQSLWIEEDVRIYEKKIPDAVDSDRLFDFGDYIFRASITMFLFVDNVIRAKNTPVGATST